MRWAYEAGIRQEATAALGAPLGRYAHGDDRDLAAVQTLSARCPSAAGSPHRWTSGHPRGLRLRLPHLSARDHAADTRDASVTVHHLCEEAREAGTDIRPMPPDPAHGRRPAGPW
ncbi:hypothetical protein [Streptomyces sp. NPDC058335]|uniref:hypothetical protein n=1 Tax=Streptomyces sp. NPDC058335 TaxID=3346451 RepID=UPI00364A6111